MSDDNVDISGLDKAAVLAALYNAAKPMGMGFLHYDPAAMTLEEARGVLGTGDDHAPFFASHSGSIGGRPGLYFDYLKGRCMKVDLTGDTVCPGGFDRDYGEGALAGVIAKLREGV